MDTSSNSLLTAALGVLDFDGTDAADLMTQPGTFTIQGFVPRSVAASYAETVWQAGLLSIATTAATALGDGATGASVLAAWQAGEVATQIEYGTVSGNVSGVALWNALNA